MEGDTEYPVMYGKPRHDFLVGLDQEQVRQCELSNPCEDAPYSQDVSEWD